LKEPFAPAVARLAAAGIESARLDARVLLAHALDCEPNDLLLRDDPSPEQVARYESFLVRREAREPVAYIVGSKEFYGLAFDVGPGVLVPRPDSETLVEAALRAFPETAARLRVLDLGTGSGCLLAAFLANRPAATGVGVDASQAALGYARRNIERHGLAARCILEWTDWAQLGPGQFEVILANPPYLSEAERTRCEPEVRDFEPKDALAAGIEGPEAYGVLAPLIADRLAPSGRTFLEIGRGAEAAVTRLLRAGGLEVLRRSPDLSGVVRCLVAGRAG
jgi:release factor glutamine methyltransferase